MCLNILRTALVDICIISLHMFDKHIENVSYLYTCLANSKLFIKLNTKLLEKS